VGCGLADTGARDALTATSAAELSGCDNDSDVLVVVLRAVAGEVAVDVVGLAGLAVPSSRMASNSA